MNIYIDSGRVRVVGASESDPAPLLLILSCSHSELGIRKSERNLLTYFLSHVSRKESDFREGKVIDLEKIKRCIGLESADGVRPMGQRNML